jgi:hypothetical protein
LGSLLPEGQIFGKVYQNRPLQIFFAGKKWWPKNSFFPPKVAEKRQENISEKFISETALFLPLLIAQQKIEATPFYFRF